MDIAPLVSIIVSIGIFFLYAVCSAVVFGILYKQAGRPAWAAFVPVYHGMVMAEVAEKPVWAGVVLGIAYDIWYGTQIFSLQGNLRIIATLLTVIFGAWLLRSFILKFDRNIGFWILWLLLPFIAVFLAKHATYKGSLPTSTPNNPQQQPYTAPIVQPTPMGTPEVQPVVPQTQPIVSQPSPVTAQPPLPQNPVATPQPVTQLQDQPFPPTQPPVGPTV